MFYSKHQPKHLTNSYYHCSDFEPTTNRVRELLGPESEMIHGITKREVGRYCRSSGLLCSLKGCDNVYKVFWEDKYLSLVVSKLVQVIILRLVKSSDGLKSCVFNFKDCYSFQVLIVIHCDMCELLVHGNSNAKHGIILCQVVYMFQWTKHVKGTIMTDVIILYLNYVDNLSGMQRVSRLKVVMVGHLKNTISNKCLWELIGNICIVVSAKTSNLDFLSFFLGIFRRAEYRGFLWTDMAGHESSECFY